MHGNALSRPTADRVVVLVVVVVVIKKYIKRLPARLLTYVFPRALRLHTAMASVTGKMYGECDSSDTSERKTNFDAEWVIPETRTYVSSVPGATSGSVEYD